MIIGKENVMRKIEKQVKLLRQAYIDKHYYKAKQIYDSIRAVVTVLEFTPEEASRIYGNRAYKNEREEETQGLLSEYLVDKIFFETCVKKGSSEMMELYKCANCPLRVKK